MGATIRQNAYCDMENPYCDTPFAKAFDKAPHRRLLHKLEYDPPTSTSCLRWPSLFFRKKSYIWHTSCAVAPITHPTKILSSRYTAGFLK